MGYVIQQPHSKTNSSDKFRIVIFDEWLDCVNGDRRGIPVVDEFDNYAEALKVLNRLRGEGE